MTDQENHNHKNIVIAIDGPAASGKGTLARRIGAHFNFAVLDTGLLYRAVGLAVLDNNQDPDDPEAAITAAEDLKKTLSEELLQNPDLRGNEVAVAASQVSAVPQVRQALLDLQRNFARTPPGGKQGAVLDGRDIGTVVCPNAAVKFFVTATPQVRATRRAKERYGAAWEAYFDDLLSQTIERDKRDSERPIAPLKPAFDAIILDTSQMDIETVFQSALETILSKTS